MAKSFFTSALLTCLILALAGPTIIAAAEAPYDLVIEKIGDVYKVSWISNGTFNAVGVGMEVENGLAVGWYRVDG